MTRPKARAESRRLVGDLRPSALPVFEALCAIARHRTRGVRVSVPQLARESGRAERSVTRALRDLHAVGVLARTYTPGPQDRYRRRVSEFFVPWQPIKSPAERARLGELHEIERREARAAVRRERKASQERERRAHRRSDEIARRERFRALEALREREAAARMESLCLAQKAYAAGDIASARKYLTPVQCVAPSLSPFSGFLPSFGGIGTPGFFRAPHERENVPDARGGTAPRGAPPPSIPPTPPDPPSAPVGKDDRPSAEWLEGFAVEPAPVRCAPRPEPLGSDPEPESEPLLVGKNVNVAMLDRVRTVRARIFRPYPGRWQRR